MIGAPSFGPCPYVWTAPINDSWSKSSRTYGQFDHLCEGMCVADTSNYICICSYIFRFWWEDTCIKIDNYSIYNIYTRRTSSHNIPWRNVTCPTSFKISKLHYFSRMIFESQDEIYIQLTGPFIQVTCFPQPFKVRLIKAPRRPRQLRFLQLLHHGFEGLVLSCGANSRELVLF